MENKKKPLRTVDKGSEELRALLEKENNEFAQRMVEFAEKGVNIAKIARAIALVPFKWKEKRGTFDMNINLKGEELEERKRLVKTVKNAFTFLTERLPPTFPDCSIGQKINNEIGKMQADLQQWKRILDEYCYLKLLEPCFDALMSGMPYKRDSNDRNLDLYTITKMYPSEKLRTMLKDKIGPARHSTHKLWTECEATIVDELRKIGLNKLQSHKETAQLLELYYPYNYKDAPHHTTTRKGDLVKLRYRSYKRTNSSDRNN